MCYSVHLIVVVVPESNNCHLVLFVRIKRHHLYRHISLIQNTFQRPQCLVTMGGKIHPGHCKRMELKVWLLQEKDAAETPSKLR